MTQNPSGGPKLTNRLRDVNPESQMCHYAARGIMEFKNLTKKEITMPTETGDLLDISSGGVPRTSLPPEPEELDTLDSLCDKILSSKENNGPFMAKLHRLVERYPDALSGWVAMGWIALATEETISAYAYFRVAYHRGLDKARASGWRGDGHIPWEIPANRPFLRAIQGLAQCADAIGESVEAKRCNEFLGMLDPNHPL